MASDKRETLREPAMALLCTLDGVDPLAALLHDERADICRAAASALGRLGDDRAMAPLLEAHGACDPDLRRVAAESLVRLGYGGG